MGDSESSDGEYDDCRGCDQGRVVSNREGMVCMNCGWVSSDGVISDEREWNVYTDGQGVASFENDRCGYVKNTYDKCHDNSKTYLDPSIMGTSQRIFCEDCLNFISNVNICNFCDSTNITTKHYKYSLEKINRIINKPNHKSIQFQKEIDELENFMIKANYSEEIINYTKDMWSIVVETKTLSRGNVRDGLKICCIYYAAVNARQPVSIYKIIKDINVNDGENAFRKGSNRFSIIFANHSKWSHLLTSPSQTCDYFEGFLSRLKIDFKYLKECFNLYEIHRANLEQLQPESAAAGIIFTICLKNNIRIKRNEFNKILGISNPTLTKSLRIINT